MGLSSEKCRGGLVGGGHSRATATVDTWLEHDSEGQCADTICEAEANGVVECLFGGISERQVARFRAMTLTLTLIIAVRCRATAFEPTL